MMHTPGQEISVLVSNYTQFIGKPKHKGLDAPLFLLYNYVIIVYKTTMTVTTNEHGQQNMFAKEPVMYYENYGMLTPNMVKERTNGRWAMVGIIAGFISYATTGNLYFGIF
jgi:hypothetical protein